ncbi:MAG: sensor histidine kinase [Verrucomicrobiales bacterium]|nr:sensor histidine kinase [Verrucomicrobiales bacterium]
MAVVLARIEDREKSFEFSGMPKHLRELFFRNWFFRPLVSVRPDKAPSTCIPYKCFETSQIEDFYDYLDHYLEGKGLPPLDSTFCLQLLQCVGEVFVNAETHSESALGVFVCGQHYPAQQRLDLTIADAGITIPERIAKRFGKHLSPVHALEWAMTKGNTTKTATPGGIGLKLLRHFACEQHGSVWIASGQAFWSISSRGENFAALDDPFPGTVVTLQIPTQPAPGALPPELSTHYQSPHA